VDINVQLHEPGTVVGRVVEVDGTPVAGAKILATSTLHPKGASEKRDFTSAEDGSFTLTLPHGWLRLEARHRGEISPAIAQWLASGQHLDGVTLTLAEPAALRGKVVTSDGTPVVDARVRLLANAVYDAKTAGDGSFAVAAVAGQAYTVKIQHSDGKLEQHVAAWNDEHVFVMPRFGGLQIVPRTPAGDTPRGEVTVVVDSFLPTGETAPRIPSETRFRGNTGVVAMTGLEPGLYDLTVAANDRGSTRIARVAVTEGASSERTVVLATPVTLRGTVKTRNQPVAHAQVTIDSRPTFTDAQGRWSLRDVISGPVAIVVVKAGFASAWVSAIASDDSAPIAIDLRPADDNTGVVDGIGVVLTAAPAGTAIASVFPGSPADGKLASGEIIEEIDGVDVTSAALPEIVARLRGAPGSSVSMKVRTAAGSRTVDLTRARLVVTDATSLLASSGGGGRELAAAGGSERRAV
jgi:hypothetical protein